MAEPTTARTRGRPNPFYLILLMASTAFAVTAWIGYVGPLIAQGPAHDPGAGTPGLADWFNRRGNSALAVELAIMIVSGLLAMATDREPSVKAAPGNPDRLPPREP